MIAVKPANFEKLAFCVVKKVLLVNISNARNILIRIPLKIAILVLALILKLVFGSFYNNTKNSDTKQPQIKSTSTKPTSQSSPSSISVVLSTASDDISVQRKSVSSRLDFGNKTSTYSLIKSVSKSSMVNFFTPNYSSNECYEFSDINSVKTSNTESIKNELLMNETDLDCDSLESSFYFDLKTHFSEKNLTNSSFRCVDDVSFV